jgi:uncharacterized protein (TIGR02231 family)
MRLKPRFLAVAAALYLSACLVPALAAEPAETASSITAVTVYLDRALVTRTAEVRCPAGRAEFTLSGLPAELADASIRVSATGATVRGMRVERVFLERAEAAEVRRIEDDLLALRDEEGALRDELGVLEGEAKFLRGLQVTVPERASRMAGEGELKLPDVGGLKETLGLVTGGLAANAARVRELNRKLRTLGPKIEARSRELAEKRSGEKLENKKVTVALESASGGAARVNLSYLLPGAMWFPAYDVRADVEKGELELVYYAVIQQATGEDWPGAELTLSASRPADRSAKPELAPWLLGGVTLPFNPPVAQEQQGGQAAQNAANNAPDIRGQYGVRFSGGSPGKMALKLQEAHKNLIANDWQVVRLFRSVAARGTSVAFPVPTRETVLTDGKPHRVALAAEKLALTPEYSVVPSLSLATYVTGKAVNTGKLPLLPGDASIYLAGDLIGTGKVDFVAPGEETSFYLGVDESVKVSRKLDGRLSSVRSFGKRQRVEAAFTIAVENFKKTPVTVKVEEALPVSQDSSIAVKVRRLEPEPAANERGLCSWHLAVPAGGKAAVNLGYTVEYPLDMAQTVEAAPAMARDMEMIRASTNK